jgi:hypothetical protein
MVPWYGWMRDWHTPRLRAAAAAVALLAVFATLIFLRPSRTVQNTSTLAARHWVTDLSLSQDQDVKVLKDVVLVVGPGSITARDPRTGAERWSRQATFRASAGDDDLIVADVGGGAGFAVFRSTTGTQEWAKAGAVEVRGFADAVLSVGCTRNTSASECVLVSQRLDGSLRWSAPIPSAGPATGVRFRLEPEAATSVPLPERMPPLVAAVVNDDERVVFASGDGTLVGRFPLHGRRTAFMTSSRVISVETAWRDGACHYALKGPEPAIGGPPWRRDDLDLETARTGSGCRQEYPSRVAGDTFWARDGDHELLLSAADGAELWIGGHQDTVLELTGNLAVVEGGGSDSLAVISLATGQYCRLAELNGPPGAIFVVDGRLLIGDFVDVVEYDVDTALHGSDFCRYRTSLSRVGELMAAGPSGFAVFRGGRIDFVAER